MKLIKSEHKLKQRNYYDLTKPFVLIDFLFFLITELQFLIFAVLTNIFNPTTELVMSIGIPIKETKAEQNSKTIKAGDIITINIQSHPMRSN